MEVQLRRFDMSSFEELKAFIPDADFALQWGGAAVNFPLEEAFFQKQLDDGGATVRPYGLYEVHGTKLLGYGELGFISRRHGTARLSRILIGDAGMRGQGLGVALVTGLLKTAFGELQLHRVDLEVYDVNSAARRCYEKLGFKLEGTRREVAKVGGVFWNSHVMSLLGPEWRAK